MLAINAELGLLGGGDACGLAAALLPPPYDASVWPPTPHHHTLSLAPPPAADPDPAWLSLQRALDAQRRRHAAAALGGLL
jgi:hypothetical protein